MLTVLGGLPRLSRDPLPDLGGLRLVDEDDEVFVGGLGDLFFDLAARLVVGKRGRLPLVDTRGSALAAYVTRNAEDSPVPPPKPSGWQPESSSPAPA